MDEPRFERKPRKAGENVEVERSHESRALAVNGLGSDADFNSEFLGAVALSHELIMGVPAKNRDQHFATGGGGFDGDEAFHSLMGERDGGGPAGIRTRNQLLKRQLLYH